MSGNYFRDWANSVMVKAPIVFRFLKISDLEKWGKHGGYYEPEDKERMPATKNKYCVWGFSRKLRPC